jgi:cytochrome c peroxidase
MLPAVAFSYSDATAALPAWYTAPAAGPAPAAADNTPATNIITDAGATLGRVLFYDTRLSANNAISCASCHIQKFGFSDTARFSRGAAGADSRHTMALGNARFYARGRFFWDERAATLEDQVLVPIQNPVEMGSTLDEVVAKLQSADFYPPLFQAAFGTGDITSSRVSLALAQFVRAMSTYGSKFDRVFAAGAAPDLSQLSDAERNGLLLFNGPAGCAVCHVSNAVIANGIHDTGLDSAITDEGAGGGRFKAPSLRNVAARGPYMHDGRFKTLADVVAFYDSGVQPSPNLDPELRNADGSPRRRQLTQTQRDALVAYLNTLTDSSFLTAAKFSNPFLRP